MTAVSGRWAVVSLLVVLVCVTAAATATGQFSVGDESGAVDDAAGDAATAPSADATHTAVDEADPVDRQSDAPGPRDDQYALAPTNGSAALDDRRLAAAIAAEINHYRGDPLVHDTVDRTLATNTTTGARLTAMTRERSARMAAAENDSADQAGLDARDRYRDAGLRDRCRLPSPYNSQLLPLERLELATGTETTGATVSEVAEAVVQQWYDRRESRRVLSVPAADHLGVGVTVTNDVAYVAVALC